MRPRFVAIAAVIVAFILGGVAGASIIKNLYIPIYEVPLLAVHSVQLSALDACIERGDNECVEVFVRAMMIFEGERAKAAIEFGIPSIYIEYGLDEHLSKLASLKEKYEPDA